MARQSRFILPGHPHLVIQRGHGGFPLFADLADVQAYLLLLERLANEHRLQVHAYGVRACEADLLVTPSDDAGLSKVMQSLARRYAQHVNDRHGRAGTPWQGRFCSAPVDADTRLLDAMLLVEGSADSSIIASSRGHHVGEERLALVVDHPSYWQVGNTPFEREARYRTLFAQSLSAELARKMRAAVINGWPLGSPKYMEHLQQTVQRSVTPSPRGRPTKAIPVPN